MNAGIDPHALESAINETDAPAQPKSRALVPRTLTTRDIVSMAGTGAVLGALALVADNLSFGGASTIAVFGPSTLYTVYRAVRHSLRDGIPGLLRDLAIVFGSFTTAVMAIDGFQGASAAMTWSLLCALTGSGILALRGARVTSTVAGPATDHR
jgi:hypothetical protein